MARLTVRKLDDDLVRRLKIRAAQNNRSAEAEHRLILARALRLSAVEFWRQADQLREELKGQISNDSTDLVHEERDRRAGLIP